MVYWSAENATKAYLKTVKMGKNAKEPDVAEFISALAAGNNAQLMVAAATTPAATSTTLGLIAAAHQTGGRVVCILSNPEELHIFQNTIGLEGVNVDFVIGEAKTLILNEYREADLVVVDCKVENYEEIVKGINEGDNNERCSGFCIVLGFNAFCKDSWRLSGLRTRMLPIGEGLLVSRVGGKVKKASGNGSNWVVKVDGYTGEEHVFRVIKG